MVLTSAQKILLIVISCRIVDFVTNKKIRSRLLISNGLKLKKTKNLI